MENIKEIKKGIRISKTTATEANLYLYNNTLYKIFNSEIMDLGTREDILNTLYNHPIEGCARIESLLYGSSLLGYGMEYYDNFITLNKTKKIPLELRKEYSHKLIDIYRKLSEAGYIYYDFHKQNILVNEEDLKLIDIDSCLYNSHENNALGMRYLNEIVLSILFDTNFFEYQVYYTKCERKCFCDILYSGLSYEYCENGSLDELDDYIDSLEEKDIKMITKKLPKRF